MKKPLSPKKQKQERAGKTLKGKFQKNKKNKKMNNEN